MSELTQTWRPALAIPALAIALLGLITKADPDLWGHLKFGLDLLRQRALPAVDPYSFTQDRPWINHEWGSEAAMGLAYSMGGVSGLVALKFALIGLALAVLWYLLRGWSIWQRTAVFTMVVWTGLPAMNTMRPQLWSVLAAVALLGVLRSGALWAAPLVCVVWANVHGGWTVGVGLVAAWALDRGWQERSAKPIGLLVACAVATLANPYGIGLWRFVLETVRLGRDSIQEWQPLLAAPAIAWLPWVASLLLVMWAGASRRLPWPLLATCLALAFVSARVMRVSVFFSIAVAVWSAPLPPLRMAVPAGVMALEAVSALAVVVTTWSVLGPVATCLRSDPLWAPDYGVASALSGATGTLALPFNWGEYAIWHWGPALKVSVDGRRETVYSDQMVMSQLRLADGEVAVLDRLRPDYAWYPIAYEGARQWFRDHGYHELAASDRSFVVSRTAQSAPVASMRGACFPN